MSKTTKRINEINTMLNSVSGLYLDDEPELEQIYNDVKKFVKKAKKEQKVSPTVARLFPLKK